MSLTRTNYVQILIASSDSASVYALLSDHGIKMRIEDAHIFVPENNVEEAMTIMLNNGFIPDTGIGVEAKTLNIFLADNLSESIIQSPKIDDAFVVINDRRVSVMLILNNDEKLPTPEVISLYELIWNFVPIWYEIQISGTNFK